MGPGELGLEYQRRDVGGSFGYPDDYPNPNRVVPTIRDGEITVWESAACVRHLARSRGPGPLWPDDPGLLATADMWTDWHRSDISQAFFPLFQALVRGLPIPPDRQHQMAQECGRLFGQLDAQLGGRTFICGDDLSIADIVNGAIMYRYMTLPIERPSLPNLQAWYQRLTERPAYQKHVMIEYGSNVEEWQAHEAANAGIQ